MGGEKEMRKYNSKSKEKKINLKVERSQDLESKHKILPEITFLMKKQQRVSAVASQVLSTTGFKT